MHVCMLHVLNVDCVHCVDCVLLMCVSVCVGVVNAWRMYACAHVHILNVAHASWCVKGACLRIYLCACVCVNVYMCAYMCVHVMCIIMCVRVHVGTCYVCVCAYAHIHNTKAFKNTCVRAPITDNRKLSKKDIAGYSDSMTSKLCILYPLVLCRCDKENINC